MKIDEPLLSTPGHKGKAKGGLRTMPFIIANEAFEKVASYGLMPNMILYLMNEYHLDMTTSTNILNLQSSATNSLPLVGAFLADSFTGRFSAIGFGSIISLLGIVLLWSTAMIPQARPPPCFGSSNFCFPASTFQLAVLCSAFGIMSIGAGGIRGSSMAFGADQLNRPEDKEKGLLEKYFGWYYAATAFSVLVAYTIIVYIQESLGWEFGFGVPAVLMLFSAVAFLIASPFYTKLQPKSSLFAGLLQVIVVSYKNRHLELPPDGKNEFYFHKSGSMLTIPSQKLRFLNKACILREPDEGLTTPEGKSTTSWNICTVDQVEELKALLKVIPLWSTGAIMSITISQPSFGTLQVKSMDRHLIPSFEIPIGSFSMFTVIFVMVWLILYDRVIIPFGSRIAGRPFHLNPKQKMGLGILFSGLAMAATAAVENIRRNEAIKEGYLDDPDAVVAMSAWWLIPQQGLLGFSEAMNIVGQIEFYVSEFPESMSSIASNFNGIGVSVSALVASGIMNTVDQVTSKGGKTSWVSSNINKGRYDYYYWVLAGLSFANLVYFWVCSWAYGPCERVGIRVVLDEEEELLA